jgi:hypothetical protein
LNDNPISFWPMSESVVSSGSPCFDMVSSDNGVYYGASLSPNPGSSGDGTTAPFFPGYWSAGGSGGGGGPPYLSGVGSINGINLGDRTNLPSFTVECWAQSTVGEQGSGSTWPNFVDAHQAGLVCQGYNILNSQGTFMLDTGGNGTNGDYQFLAWDWNYDAPTPATSTQNGSDDNWHHVVGVCDGDKDLVSLFIDGALQGSAVAITPSLGLGAPVSLNGASFDETILPITFACESAGSGWGYWSDFEGCMDNVAIYGYALTPAQVLAHYATVYPTPGITAPPTNTTANVTGTANFYVTAYGAANGGKLAYQWYVSTNAGADYSPVSGQITTNLVIPDLTANESSNYYEVVVTNHFGSVTSAPAILTVLSGAPQIITDIPTNLFALDGQAITLGATVGGTPPFTYAWQYTNAATPVWTPLTPGGRITISPTTGILTIYHPLPSDAASYQELIYNAYTTPTTATSATASAICAVTFVGAVGLNDPMPAPAGPSSKVGTGSVWTIQSDGDNHYLNDGLGGGNFLGLVMTNNGITLTTGGTGNLDYFGNKIDGTREQCSAYLNIPVNIDNFTARFTYQFNYAALPAGENPDEGVSFVIQNSPSGADVALGGDSSHLAIVSPAVIPSLEFEIDIYNAGYNFEINGVRATNFPYTGNNTNYVNFWNSSDPVQFTISYTTNGNTAVVTLLDLVSGHTENHTYTYASTTANGGNFPKTSLPELLGSDTAYIGFAGSTGVSSSEQSITNFSFSSYSAPATLSASVATVAANRVVTLSWPIGAMVGNPVLQSAPTLAAGSAWTTVSPQPAISVVSGSYQVTVPQAGSQQFYQLVLQP